MIGVVDGTEFQSHSIYFHWVVGWILSFSSELFAVKICRALGLRFIVLKAGQKKDFYHIINWYQNRISFK